MANMQFKGDLAAEDENFSKLHARQKNDYIKWYLLEKYQLLDEESKKVPKSKSVTLNDSRTFADRYMSIMGSGKMNLEINSGDSTHEKKCEEFFPNIMDVADEINSRELIEPIDYCCNFNAGIFGWLCNVVIMLKYKDIYVPYIKPVNPLWAKWRVSADGLEWASFRTRFSGYALKTLTQKTQFKDEELYDLDMVYSKKEWLFFGVPKDANNKKYEYIWHIEHGLPRCPVALTAVPGVPHVITTESDYATALSRQGESVFAANRDLYPEINELASVLATINLQQFLTPLAYLGEREFNKRPFGIGVVVELLPNEKLVEIPTKEMSVSGQNLFGQLISRIQRGSIPSVDYGELSFELSALAIAKLTEARNQIFEPRLKAKSTHYRKIFNLIREQISLDKCYQTECDEVDAVQFDKAIFEKKFKINISFSSISPEENIANYNTAQSAIAIGRPKKVVFRDVLKVKNPEEELMLSELENAHKEIPALRLYHYGIAQAGGSIRDAVVKDTSTQIILWAVKDMMRKQTPGQEIPEINIPDINSQTPRQNLEINKPSGEKIARMNNRRAGIAQLQKGRQAQVTG